MWRQENVGKYEAVFGTINLRNNNPQNNIPMSFAGGEA